RRYAGRLQVVVSGGAKGGRGEEAGAFGIGWRGDGGDARVLEVGCGEPVDYLIRRKTGVELVHLAAEVVAAVGEEVDDDQGSAGFEDAGGFEEDGLGVGGVGEGEEQECGVAGGGFEGDGGEVTFFDGHVRQAGA